MRKFTQQDLNAANNMLKLLAKSKNELTGIEILAASDTMRWFSNLVKTIEDDLKQPVLVPISIPPVQVPQSQQAIIDEAPKSKSVVKKK